MALNLVWLGFFVVAFATACVRLLQGDVEIFARLLAALFDAARSGFDIALGLTGMMALWLGLLRIGEKAGMVDLLARAAAPLLRQLFPGVPAGHPAQGAMTMNLSANLLGLDNAATPLGLKAMRELETLNPRPGTASDAQIMFVVLNTAGLTLIPTSVIAIRQSLALRQGVPDFNAADIFLPTLLATFASCLAGLLAVAVCQRLPLWRPRFLLRLAGVLALLAALLAGLARLPAEQAARITGMAGAFCILALVVAFLVAGAWHRLPVYETFVDGAKEGFGVAVQIVPYLVGMLCAIALFRAAGCMDWLLAGVGRGVAALGWNTAFLPALPVGLMKVLSGAGARGLMVDVMQTYGVASFPGRLAAVIQGSTETTFYVLAVYGGSVGLRTMRYALGCALVADGVGVVAAVAAAYWFFGGG
ncbi:nucleoside recognition domain-containing protein [Xylophilus ampelinus]|uniref:Spore maturation protein SpmA n=1 Tax=Xylophilus ampelinus TaxID=54067 RepID=A0A318SH36_9BURK|nr:nucleoside recognition domain-containing protein [Xylophilus ampelinus]MCS4510629.1 hypothetical protein [Xylophilus ampelinus]PYE76320.1 spore maturation protein SpmA [Xylophilus ampelinus]